MRSLARWLWSAALLFAALPAQSLTPADYDKREAMIPMRDGVELYTELYTPREVDPNRQLGDIASKLLFENDRVRIWEMRLEPGAKSPVHKHELDHVLIQISGDRMAVCPEPDTGSVYNEYEFVGHGLRSSDSRARMEETVEILQGLWRGGSYSYQGEYFDVSVPELRPRPVQPGGPPLWRSVISPGSFSECGRLGLPILTARLPVEVIGERWAMYRAGLEEGGHPEDRVSGLLQKSALWRNVYVADSDAQAEDELQFFTDIETMPKVVLEDEEKGAGGAH